MNAITKDGWALLCKGQPVFEGTKLTCSRGEVYVVTGGRPPHKPGSTGRVWVHGVGKGDISTREYFPSVVDCAWVRQDASAAH